MLYHMKRSSRIAVPGQMNEEDPPPAYEESVDVVDIDQEAGISDYSRFTSSGKGLASAAKLTNDGRISVNLNLKKALPDLPSDYSQDVEELAIDKQNWSQCPRLNIVIMIVGSRGDVQPYVALGKRLKLDGHRVRLATHETFRQFVGDAGLEFFAIGGDPQDLMSYMVKNPGLVPGMESMMNGDISKKRKMLSEMMNGCWNACHAACPKTGRTFAADAIISNPPAFAHIHCAEALGIPVHLSFTMPWSPTTAFPHPLVNINESNAEDGLTNYLSYTMAEILTWQGMGDIINKLRTRSLGLPPLSLHNGPNLADSLKVPWTYCMSPALIPKPKDWKQHIDVVGFYFLDLATNYTPPDDLVEFLKAGEPPVYIGFGSVVVEDPKAMTEIIFEATQRAGVRALISAGWGGLGGVNVPPNVYILGNIPHDWLFDKGRVKAVVHHGGAGTTAAGLSKGLPTAVVPFFGDQGFWGSMIYKAGAGPAPIPQKQLNVENLTEAMRVIVSPEAQTAAKRMAAHIRLEDGVKQGVESFYRHLPLKNMRCDLDPSRVAVWWSSEYCLRMSGFAAQVLMDEKKLKLSELDPHRPIEYVSARPPTDPVTGAVANIFWALTDSGTAFAEIFESPVKGAVRTATAIPGGMVKVVSAFHEGFENAPRLYGSQIRPHKEVTGIKSGLIEGGKALFYGYYDGFTGVVREPIQGAKEEGWRGALKGSARGVLNVGVRPVAGIFGVAAHPIVGLWKSCQSIAGSDQQRNYQYSTRLQDGVTAVHLSTLQQRQDVLQKFEELKVSTKQRRKAYKEAAEKEVKMWSVRKVDKGKGKQRETLVPSTSRRVPPKWSEEPSTLSTSVSEPILPEYEHHSASQHPTYSQEELDDMYQRDLDMAMKLSVSDQWEPEQWTPHTQENSSADKRHT